MLKPTEALAEVADLLAQTVKNPYREESMTPTELDSWTDRILRWAESQKVEWNHGHRS